MASIHHFDTHTHTLDDIQLHNTYNTCCEFSKHINQPTKWLCGKHFAVYGRRQWLIMIQKLIRCDWIRKDLVSSGPHTVLNINHTCQSHSERRNSWLHKIAHIQAIFIRFIWPTRHDKSSHSKRYDNKNEARIFPQNHRNNKPNE